MAASTRQHGTVVRLIPERGFGFIKGQDGMEYFFHSSGLANCSIGQLAQGTPVSFMEEQNSKGPRAKDVTLLGGETA